MDLLFERVSAQLLATSVQTVVLVALVWSICRYVKRLPAATQCGLWWLVALQATLGLVWASPLQLPLLPAPDAAPALIAAAPVASAAFVALPQVTAAPATAAAIPWPMLLLALWMAGVLVMALRTLRAWRASRALLQASQPCADAQLVGALRMAAEAHGLREPPQLRVSAQIRSPQLIGPWRPVLLLPARHLPTMADADLEMALTHELVHLRRGDLWFGLLPALAQHLFFFHPLVHLAAREYALAREAAVDAAVVAGNRHCRHDYGRLLVQLGVAPRPVAGLASASPTFLSLKRRLLMLQNTSSFPRVGAGLILATVALVGVLPLRLVAMPVAPPPPLPPVVAIPAPPAPPAPPPAVAAPLPVAPVAPVAPAALPAPPKPPAAPKPPMAVSGRLDLSHDATRNAFVLLQDGHNVMNGSMEDLDQAQRLDDGRGVLWFRRDGRSYVVRDAGTLSRFQQLYAQSTRLGQAQAQLGEQQGELGARQGEIGRGMGEMGARIGAIAAQQAQLALQSEGTPEAARAAAAEARKAAAEVRANMQQKGLDEEMKKLAAQQAALGKQQAELGRQQAAASAAAERQAEQLIQQAIRAGLATPVDG